MAAIRTIDQERRRLDVTQRALCRQARVSVATYTRIKHGKVSGTERTFVRLRNALTIMASREAAE